MFWVYGAVLSVATSTLSMKKSTNATSLSATAAATDIVFPLIRSPVTARFVTVGVIVSKVAKVDTWVPAITFPTASFAPLTITM